MATKQSQWAKGRKQSPSPDDAGDVFSATFIYDLGVGGDGAVTAASDVIEMGFLPGLCKLVDATLIGAVGSAITCSVGLMSGTPGDPDPARTVDATIFAAATSLNAAATRLSLYTAFDLAHADTDRSIGITVSADCAVSAGRYIKLIIYYRAAP